MKTGKILASGIVQGVGFRPTVYRIASKLKLKGHVRNLGNIVEIILQGSQEDILKFKEELVDKLPPIAKINSLTLDWLNDDYNYKEFKIIESSKNYSGTSVIPADIGICDKCLEEINNPNNRRYKHPFNACTDCGPRFTLIESVPYDRDKTTMDEFPLCNECNEEYTNPLNRRYHGEAICCDLCGPSLKLINKNKEEIKSKDPIKETVNLLNKGNIFAIKGIGGTHLVAKVTSQETVDKLRKRIGRENQPFAVMSKNIETVKTFGILSEKEERSLSSRQKPIVVIKKNENYNFAESVAPSLHNIGVMLPYTGLHHLIFNENTELNGEPAFIMTSANVPGEPMMINNEDIINNLEGIYDYALIHNRKIINRCDDSVIRYRNNELSFIRRSRGYTPEPYSISPKMNINNDLNILALGPELDVTFTILTNGQGYVSQHIGNTNKYKTYQFLQNAIEHMMKITKTSTFDIIACDMHPQFFTSKLAKELAEKYNAQLITVQHHHGHGIALANDNNIDELVFIAADGVGYGSDNTAWGGEIMYTDVKSFERLGNLMPQKMPGGDNSTKYPVKMLCSVLLNEKASGKKYSSEEIENLMMDNYIEYFKYGEIEVKNLIKQIQNNLNVGISSSTGRILDSISAALKICGERTYEGEASMKLESAAFKSENPLKIPYKIIKEDNKYLLDTSLIVKEVMKNIKHGANKYDIANGSQIAIGEGLSEIAVKTANEKGINCIGATGGVFYNEAITLTCKNYIENEGFKFIQHTNSCAGDGSVSLGQAIISNRNFKNKNYS